MGGLMFVVWVINLGRKGQGESASKKSKESKEYVERV
jgi:hypothetical protein